MSYTIADYIIDRLVALGVRHAFGVAGNYTAQFLFATQKDKRIEFVCTTNELEAGYAADAYSRTERIGVVCVTYGVGTFSLYNAIAGAFVERCPVVLINGIASAAKTRQLVEQGVLFAHAIDPLRTDLAIFTPITAATAKITNSEDAPAQIDRVLIACLTESRPVYLEVPDLVWEAPCHPPKSPPTNDPLKPLPHAPGVEHNIQVATGAAVDKVQELVDAAQSPVLWGGEELQRLGLENEFEKLVTLTRFPYTTTLLGKGLISERNDRFIGVYDSVFAPKEVRDVVEGADCLIALGTILSDFYGSIVGKQFGRMVLGAGGAIRIGHSVVPNVPLDRFLRTWLARFEARLNQTSNQSLQAESCSSLSKKTPPAGFAEVRANRARRRGSISEYASLRDNTRPMTWDMFFAVMRMRSWKDWLVMVDTSMAIFPSAELLIEGRGQFIAQTAWLSIGYTTGASVGSSFAIPHGKRVAAFIGDGGFQMVPQCLSTLARARKPAVLFVFNNGLYGIEQYLVDKTFFHQAGPAPAAFFNELPTWDYESLARAFLANYCKVATLNDLAEALNALDQVRDTPTLVEVKLLPNDLPAELRQTLAEGTVAAGFAGKPAGSTIAVAGFN